MRGGINSSPSAVVTVVAVVGVLEGDAVMEEERGVPMGVDLEDAALGVEGSVGIGSGTGEATLAEVSVLRGVSSVWTSDCLMGVDDSVGVAVLS